MLFRELYAPRVRRRGLHSDVVAELGLRVVRGDYPPGETLPRADELAAELGVSRTVIRETLRVLTEKGLVIPRQRTGTRVRSRDEWNLVDPELIAWQRLAGPDLQFFRDLSEVRVSIETTAARLAAERATPAERERIQELFGEMERQITDPARYARADMELHTTILRATHNLLLAQLTHTVSEGLMASRDITVRSTGASEASMPLHAEVVDAIVRRDGERAAAGMARIVERALADIERILGGETVLGADRIMSTSDAPRRTQEGGVSELKEAV
jgi:DNA-binding FadR family transcriptional regulator